MPWIVGEPTTGRQFSNITLDDADGNPVSLHKTVNRHIYQAAGLIGISAPRQIVRPRPSRHGAVNDTRNTDGRLIVLDGRCISSTSAEEAEGEFLTILSAMMETLDEGPALLKWTTDGGIARQALVKLHGEVVPQIVAGPNIIAYQAQFLAEDPRSYGQDETTGTGGALTGGAGGFVHPAILPIVHSASASGTVAVNNEGNRPTPPVLRIYGAATNPQVLLVDSDYRIAINGSVAAGDYLEIDVQARTIRLNGTSPALSLLDAANTTWFEIPKGTSTIQLLAGTFDASARVDVLYRPAYT